MTLLVLGTAVVLVTYTSYGVGKEEKTLPDLSGRCIVRLDVSQFAGHSTSHEVKKLHEALMGDAKCGGSIKSHVIYPAK